MYISVTHPLQLVRRDVYNSFLYLYFTGLTAPCCDLCLLKKVADTSESLMQIESDILALRDQIINRKGPIDQGSQEQGDRPGNEIDVDAPISVRNSIGEGSRCGDRLEACRNVLMSWRFDIWKRDFKWTILMPEVILPDKVLTKLVLQA